MTTENAAEIFDQLSFLSQPRPNGSEALERAVEGVQAWLRDAGIPVQPHAFVLRPYFMEMLGLWLALAGLLLPVAALTRWGWAGTVLALLAVAIPLLEVRFLRPTLTALVRRPAWNLVVHLPASQPAQEVVLCAHLDSKTELLDHVSRRIFLRLSGPAVVLALGSGLLIGLETVLPPGTARLVTGWLAFAMALPLAVYGLGMGVNLIGGRINSDAFAFLRHGVPATTLGSYDAILGGRGYHSAQDSPERVDPDRLQETVLVLVRFLRELDTKDGTA